MRKKNIVILLLPLILISCSNSYIENIDRMQGYEYRPGFPEMRLVTSSFIDEQNIPKVNLAIEIVYGSLIYKKNDNLFEAKATLDIQILSKSNETRTTQNLSYPITLNSGRANISLSQDTYLFEKEYEIEPGEYEIIATLTDSSSSRETIRRSETIIPDPDNDEFHITNIRILAKEDADDAFFLPITTYDIPGEIDSLKFVFQITNKNLSDPISINMKLLRFKSDTSAAREMSFPNYPPGHIGYRGIEYDEKEEISSNRRILTDPGSVLIEFLFPQLERGNYRLEITTNPLNGEKLYKARDFAIKSPSYPTLRTARELAQPLIYLMGKKDHQRIMRIEDEDTLKKEIDRFWLKNLKNSSTAKDVISLFYERVEEANKQFSNYKEGWKTDMGMIYILFGPPWYLENSLTQMRWGYSFNSTDPEKNFYFYKPRIKDKFYPFDNYLLRRSNMYHNLHYVQREKWLNGTILRDNL